MSRWLLPLAAAAALTAPAAAADPPPGTPVDIPYRLTDTKHVLVRAKLNGKGPFNFILDTGAPAVFIPKSVAAKAGVELDDAGWGTFDRFEVEGGLTVPKARTRVEDLFQLQGMNGMGLAGVELHGVIGYNVLARYRITYDFTADKLRWVPLAFDPPDPRGLSRDGGQGGLEVMGPVMKVLAGLMGITPNFETRPRGFLGLEVEDRDGAVVVKAVLPDGPAAKAGLKPGDEVKAAGVGAKGKKPAVRDVDRLRDFEKALAAGRPGQEARFEVRRGDTTTTVTATLAGGL